MSDSASGSAAGFRIHHTMLPVADLDSSVAFYTRLLGMQVMGQRVDETRQVKVCHVGYGDRATQPSIELTQPLAAGARASVRAFGGHVAIHLTGLRDLCAVMEKEGVKFAQPLKLRGPGGRNLVTFVMDPDGHELELVERASGS